MNIAIINTEEILQKDVLRIREYLESLNEKEYTIKVTDRLTKKSRCDICLLLSNDSKKMIELFNKHASCHTTMILTDNYVSSHVLKCIELTPYVMHMKNNLERIFNKITRILRGEINDKIKKSKNI